MTEMSAFMTADRFQALIDAYGADPVRWPEGERLAAARYVDGFPEARALLAEALTLDGALAALPKPELPSGLLENVLAAAAGASSAPASRTALAGDTGAVFWWSRFKQLLPKGPNWAPASVLAGAVALGMVAGVNLKSSSLVDDASGDQLALMLPDAQDLTSFP